MENRWTRDGLIVDAETTRASGHAERLAAVALIEPHADGRSRSCSVPTTGTTPVTSSIKLRDKAVTPHVAQDQSGRRSAIDHRTTRRPGYAVSRHLRKRIGEAVGWANGRKVPQDAAPRPAQGRLAVHPCHGRLWPHPACPTCSLSECP
jgi:hypothetical protein